MRPVSRRGYERSSVEFAIESAPLFPDHRDRGPVHRTPITELPDLILLCAGAAIDDDASATDASSQLRRLSDRLRGGACARAFAAGSIRSKAEDAAAIPSELPEEGWLRRHFGLPASDAVAASTAAIHGIPLPAWHATPCHVRIGHYQLVLDDPTVLELTLAEARALGDTVAQLFAEAGLELRIPSPLDWFLLGRPDFRLQARSWSMALGRSIDGYLPQGPDASTWRRLFTEAQIAWHDHPVNLQRSARGQPPVNALWLDGLAHAALPSRHCAVFSHSPALLGLARRAGGQAADVEPEHLTLGGLQEAARNTEVIVDVDFWRRDGAATDPYAWDEAWTRFERWLGALGLDRRLPSGIDGLRAVFGGHRRFVELETRAGFRWPFRRRFDAVAAVLGT